MTIYDGYEPNEKFTVTHRPAKRFAGHAVVATSKQRLGSRFAFRYAVTCECGKRYTSKTSHSTAWIAWERHWKKETA